MMSSQPSGGAASGLNSADAVRAETSPAGQASHLAPAGEPTAQGRWPYLPREVLDQRWQQAIEEGPRLAGRQVAYALAASLQSGQSTPPIVDAEIPDLLPPALDERTGGLLALAALAEHLPMKTRMDLLAQARALPDHEDRVRVILPLAGYLPGETRRRAIHDVVQAAEQITDPVARVRALAQLLPLLHAAAESELPSGIVAETLDLASAIHNPEARLRSLTAIAPHVPSAVRVALLLAVLDTVATLSQSDTQAGALIALAPFLVGEVHHRTLTVAAHIKDPASRARALTGLAPFLPERLQPRLRAAALEAIAVIPNEEERARALVAFAPHLEMMSGDEDVFPVLLERALEIAIGMHQRAARARALAGLHARLPRELHGEALAAVNSIPDEHTRAQLLAEMAPGLPGDMTVAAMAVAHDIRQRDARYLALKTLASNLPIRAADRTWQDALAVAVALPRQLERVLALAELVPNLPEDLAHRTLISALTTARSISKERARVRALSTLAPLLVNRSQLMADALADAHALTNPFEKVSALIALLPYLPAGETTDRTIKVVLDMLSDISVEYRRARALSSLAAYLTAATLSEAVDIARAIEDPFDRSTTLIALLPQLVGDAHADVLDQAWQAAREILDPYDRAMALITLWSFGTPNMQTAIVPAVLDAVRDIQDEYDRASGISAFAPLLASEEMPAVLPAESQVLREALLAACQLEDRHLRGEMLGLLATSWSEIQPVGVAYTLWCEVLLLLSRRPVPDLLCDLASLVPVLTALGGQTAAREAAEAVGAARHWPLADAQSGTASGG